MAFFKFRFPGRSSKESPPPAGPAESIETLRRRARHRLIGAAILVLLGVVGFPLLFDTQPRPVAVDIPIEIPDKAKARPPAMPEPAPAVASSSGVITEAAPAAPATSPAAAPTPAPAPAAAPAPAPEPKAAAKAPEPAKAAEPKAPPKAAASAEPKKQDDAARAQALLEGKAPAAAATGRFVVQVGAFSDNAKAREAQRKLERAGLKNYVHVVEKDGQKIARVRAGPFPTRAEADKAADRIKGLDLPAAILTLG